MGMGERDSEGLSAQERLEQLRAQRMAPKDPGVHIESDAANGRLDINWNSAGAPKHHVSINLSRIVDAIPTVIRFLPVRIFTVWGSLLGLVSSVPKYRWRRYFAYGSPCSWI